MNVRSYVPVMIALAVPLASGCASHAVEDLAGSRTLHTLVNLHPDEPRSRLYAANFQQAGLIPVCSEVTLTELGNKRLVFRVKATGKSYNYEYHKSAAEPFLDHLRRYFGTDCNTREMEHLSATDQKGIREGRAYVGMTKSGVTYALGYPPRRETSDQNSRRWKYWRSRFDTFLVEFDEAGRVSKIVD